MWPWGHLALGYLGYSGLSRRRGVPITTGPLILLVGATQLPDLIDKPLSWSIGLLGAGRSLGHSGLIVGVMIAVLAIGVRVRPSVREDALAVGVGLVSHLLGDVIDALVTADLAALAFLGWPILSIPPSDPTRSILGMFLSMRPTPFFLAQLVLTGVGIWLWLDDGCPGLDLVRTAIGRDRYGRPP